MFVCFVYGGEVSLPSSEDRDRARAVLAIGGKLRILTEDGTTIDLPGSVAGGLVELLEVVAAGDRCVVVRSGDNLTTEQAAVVLGVSRPTVVRLVDTGRIPARMVGTHRRLALADVLAYRDVSTKRRGRALEAMAHDAEASGLYRQPHRRSS